MDQSPILFKWIFNCSSTICGKDYSFSLNCLCASVKKSSVQVYVDVFLDSLVFSIYLYVYLYASTTLCYYSFIIIKLEIG